MRLLKKGYSLVEVLAALAIISIAILPIMSMYPAIFKTNASASQMEEASRIALTIVDFIKAKGYSSLTNTNTNTDAAFNVNTVFGGSTKVVEDSGTNPNGYLYSFKNISGGYITVRDNLDFALDNDLKYNGNSAITNLSNAFIILNSKGLNLRECVVRVILKQENVLLTDSNGSPISTNVINPAGSNGFNANTGTASSIMYGSTTNHDRFVVGRVIIGWGKNKTVSSPTGRQQLDQSLTGKERVYGVNFVVTPIEN